MSGINPPYLSIKIMRMPAWWTVDSYNTTKVQSVLDLLWQKISWYPTTLIVAINGKVLYVVSNRLHIPNDDIPILFTGTPQEVYYQIDVYLRMMEGR
jgi:hypothetical protein